MPGHDDLVRGIDIGDKYRFIRDAGLADNGLDAFQIESDHGRHPVAAWKCGFHQVATQTYQPECIVKIQHMCGHCGGIGANRKTQSHVGHAALRHHGPRAGNPCHQQT